jgi:hypothetical protein
MVVRRLVGASPRPSAVCRTLGFSAVRVAAIAVWVVVALEPGFCSGGLPKSSTSSEAPRSWRVAGSALSSTGHRPTQIDAVDIDLPAETPRRSQCMATPSIPRCYLDWPVCPLLRSVPCTARARRRQTYRRGRRDTIINGITTSQCTAAFEVYYYAGNIDNSPNVGTLTAGHCGTSGDPYTATANSAMAIGTFRGDSYDGRYTQRSDGAVIRDLPVPVVNASNRLIDARDHERRVTGVTDFGSGFDAVGATICKYGSTSWDTCGVLQDNNLTVRLSNGKTYANQRKATVYICFGDSGGRYSVETQGSMPRQSRRVSSATSSTPPVRRTATVRRMTRGAPTSPL